MISKMAYKIKKDRRQVNEVWSHTNPQGETYLYARVGSGKNSYIKTLKYLGKKKAKISKNVRFN